METAIGMATVAVIAAVTKYRDTLNKKAALRSGFLVFITFIIYILLPYSQT